MYYATLLGIMFFDYVLCSKLKLQNTSWSKNVQLHFFLNLSVISYPFNSHVIWARKRLKAL